MAQVGISAAFDGSKSRLALLSRELAELVFGRELIEQSEHEESLTGESGLCQGFEYLIRD